MLQVLSSGITYVAMTTQTCFKSLFSCVSDVSDLCCESGSGCCICCYGYICMFHMFQFVYVTHVAMRAACRSRLVLLLGHRVVHVQVQGRGSRRWRVMRVGIRCKRGPLSGTDTASGAGFGVGQRELHALGTGVGAAS
jgi:hypothetical protein